MDLYNLKDDAITSKNAAKVMAKNKNEMKFIPSHIQKTMQQFENNELEDAGQEQPETMIPPSNRFHEFMIYFVDTKGFSNFIMGCILVNSILLALEVDPSTTETAAQVYSMMDVAFLVIYTIELVLKNYVDFKGYWSNNFNRFDALVLFFSYITQVNVFSSQGNFSVFRILRAFRAFRAFRGVSFIRPLQVIVTALIKTFGSIINLILLMLLFIFVFAIIGINFFGSSPITFDDWGTLGNAMYTLFIYVTADNWSDIQSRMDEAYGLGSRFYSVLFIFIGNLIFTNLFIGIIIQNLDEATEEDKRIQKLKRQKVVARKKAFIEERQKRDYEKLLARKKINPGADIQQILGDMVGRLPHNDMVPMNHIGCNLKWMEAYLIGLNHQENTMYRCQQIHFEIATTLAEFVERQYQLQRNPDARETGSSRFN